MTQDEILEALHRVVQENKHYTTWTVSTPHLVALVKLAIEHERERLTDAAMKAAEKGIDTAIALEREACAKVCESMNKYMDDGEECATAIRARGQA
jgi:GTPase involved in cell partitioning and DNA repair